MKPIYLHQYEITPHKRLPTGNIRRVLIEIVSDSEEISSLEAIERAWNIFEEKGFLNVSHKIIMQGYEQ